MVVQLSLYEIISWLKLLPYLFYLSFIYLCIYSYVSFTYFGTSSNGIS